MLDLYIEHFMHGDVEKHKEAQKVWLQNKNPTVEMNIGFTETYEDPSGQRGTFGGWCALVDKNTSVKYKEIVDNGKELIDKLPWAKDFESSEFKRPVFMKLFSATFGSNMIPNGINLPNYNEIR